MSAIMTPIIGKAAKCPLLFFLKTIGISVLSIYCEQEPMRALHSFWE